MQLAVLLAILASFSATQALPEPLAGPPAWTLLAACWLAAPLATLVASAWVVRGIARDFPSHDLWVARYQWLQRGGLGLWLVAIGVAFYGCRWPVIVRAGGEWTSWPLAVDLATIAPVLVALLVMWTAFWLVERSLCQATPQLGSYLITQSRHFLLLPLVPVLFVLACRELLEWWAPASAAGAFGQGVQASVVISLLFLAPLVVIRVWSTTSLPAGELRTNLLAACNASGCHLRDILVWNTEGRMANAAILGFVPRLRYLLLTDALLDCLAPDELELVIRHEATHVARRHLLTRVAVLVLPLWIWFWCERAWPGLEGNWEQLLQSIGLGALVAKSVIPLISIAYAVTALGWLSHRLEYDADLGVVFPTGLEGPQSEDPAAREHSVDLFAAALYRIVGSIDQTSWLHPAPRRRIEFLDHCAADPALAHRFRGRMFRLERLVLAAYVAAPLIAALGLLAA